MRLCHAFCAYDEVFCLHKFEVLKTLMWKSTCYLRRIIVSDTESGSLNILHVCPYCGLCPHEDFIRSLSEAYGSKRKRHR